MDLSLLGSFALATGMDACAVGTDESDCWISGGCLGGEFCRTVRSSPLGKARCLESHMDAGRHAMNLGEPYISRCHAGLVFIAAPLTAEDEYAGCVCCMPALMWDWDEVAIQEINQRTSELRLPSETLLISSKDIPVLSADRIRSLADTLYAVAMCISGGESSVLIDRREKKEQQMRLADMVIQKKIEDDPLRAAEGQLAPSYPMQLERELLGKVRLGDRAGARGILNDMLGHIFYRMAGNIEVMKARILELLIMISRAAVESGAELEKLLGLNYNFIAELSGLTLYEDICMWVVKVLDTFMDTVYATRNVRNSRFLSDALSHIRGEYMNNLTLDDVAGQVHISPFYLSHLFKEELGITFIEYLTRVRVEEAKKLLTQSDMSMSMVASSIGYEDASYFSKVFKKNTGLTPNQYRKGN